MRKSITTITTLLLLFVANASADQYILNNVSKDVNAGICIKAMKGEISTKELESPKYNRISCSAATEDGGLSLDDVPIAEFAVQAQEMFGTNYAEKHQDTESSTKVRVKSFIAKNDDPLTGLCLAALESKQAFMEYVGNHSISDPYNVRCAVNNREIDIKQFARVYGKVRI